MYKASAGVTLPTSIIGSLPRPAWYTATLGTKSFLEAMVNSRYREQYEDAVSCFLRAQETAGLDILTELIAVSVEDDHYKDPVERTWAISDALNAELSELADAGCPVVQMEEPQIHMVPARGKTFGKLDVDDLVKIFNNTVKGLRAKTEVWCHTCWGNPSQQRIFRDVQSYQPTLDALNRVDADALTFETCSSGPGDLKAIGEVIKDQKIVIG